MNKCEQTMIGFTPNSQAVINNKTGNTQNYRLEFGEYGSVEFEVLAGGVVTINTGTKPYTINVLEPKSQPGVSGIVKNCTF